jgi:hypothetical protein
MRHVGSQGPSTANDNLSSDPTLRLFKSSGSVQKNVGDCILKLSVLAINMKSVRLPRVSIAEGEVPFL